MSKGSKVLPFRIPAELLAEVDGVIERSHDTRAGEPWTRTAFILAALKEKLAHMRRSNTKKKKRRSADVGGQQRGNNVLACKGEKDAG